MSPSSANFKLGAKFLNQETAEKEEALQRLQRAAATDSTSQRIAIDLGFDSIMNDKEIRSLANQLKLSYGAIKQMPEPFQLLFCNPSEQLEHSLERFGASNWYIQWRRGADSVAEHFPSEDLVYLSPDSPNVLEKIDPTKIYVIGGIVDKSRKKVGVIFCLSIQQLKAFRSQIGRKAIRRRQKQQMLQNSPAATLAKDVAPAQNTHHNSTRRDIVHEAGNPEAELSPVKDLTLWLEDLAA
ncbi:unnamed protein product [Phytophthora fragariaefolia]|uniref:tRNA (guanine(9)-N(1))-methyltransferase n=1 Tax=Phytophthora fragariaefolia TaxID=1490495 RepID=A0A9W7CGL5_9STRA|nr:unnamed protein product [Phytophthora fragariaefolia]